MVTSRCRLLSFQWSIQNPTVDAVHREEVLPVNLADLVNADDVWMAQSSGRLRFLVKTADVILRGQSVHQDHLDGDDAVEVGLASSKDDAHASAAEFFQKFEPSELTRGHRFSL